MTEPNNNISAPPSPPEATNQAAAPAATPGPTPAREERRNNRFDAFTEEDNFADIAEDIVDNRAAQRIAGVTPETAALNATTDPSEEKQEENPKDDSADTESQEEKAEGGDGKKNDGEKKDDDDKSNKITAIDCDSDSTMSSLDATPSKVITTEGLIQRMERIDPGVAAPQENPDCAEVIRFWNAMGDAIAELPCEEFESGHAGIVCSLAEHRARIGSTTATPPKMPRHPVDQSLDPDKTIRRAHAKTLKFCVGCEEVRDAGTSVPEKKFGPTCLDLLKVGTSVGRRILPLTTTLIEAFEHVLEETNSDLSKQELAMQLRDGIPAMANACVHTPSSDSWLKHTGELENAKAKIDAPDPSKLPIDDLIMCVQKGLRSALEDGAKELREISSEWTRALTALGTVSDAKKWLAFKKHCSKALKKCDEDKGELVCRSEQAQRQSEVSNCGRAASNSRTIR